MLGLGDYEPKEMAELGERQKEILNVARRVLIEDGYASFTLRRIAKRAGMHLKTLQHYFETKKTLLMATVRHTLQEYYFDTDYSRIDNIEDRDPIDALSWVLDFLINDVKSEDTCKFFLELWALSLRDEDASEALDALYTLHRKQLEKLLAKANTTLSKKTLALRAAAIVEQIEGMVIFAGYGKPSHSELLGLEKEVHRKLMEYALSPEVAD
jgi:AcrR family transcriptional regulator